MCARAADLKAAGATRVVACVKENIDAEIAEFRANYWSEEIVLDADKRFFLALGGGTLHTPYEGAASFLAMVMNPFSKARAKVSLKRAAEKGVKGNFAGEGFINGGVYVVRQDGKAAYAFLEEDTGDHAAVEDIIDAVKAATRGEVFVLAPASTATPGEPRKTWRQWAGRTAGQDGYVKGDISRGIVSSGCSVM